MSSEEQEFESWKEVIVNFFETRISQSGLYKARDYIEKKENEIKKEKDENKLNRLVSAKERKQLELIELRKEAPSTEIRDWLDINSVKTGCIMKATHVLKFSHSSASAEGVFLEEKSTDTMLSTSSLKKATVPDLAHSNGALISISRFLFLEVKGERIIDLVLNNNFVFLNGFNKNKEQVNIWGKGFLNLVEATRQIKTTDKAKQIYFPLDDSKKYTDVKDISYHIITPLFSSSLLEELYQHINNLTYGEEQKIIKEYKNPKNDSPLNIIILNLFLSQTMGL